MPKMVEPKVVPREAHTISRRDMDPDALKVLYRLRQFDHIAYLVGGSVRDLLLGRRPKDFDIGTSAHPHQIKKLFHQSWIIGRRFRLVHVKFGPKVIEVATFRRQLAAGEAGPERRTGEVGSSDNTFGTPEEDAFRRDFTINALFYDIATFSVIDYVGGLDDLRARIVRSIGDPDVRLREDPVRMLRAVALSARLDFTIEPDLLESIRRHRHEISKSSAPRLLEEQYKILRAGASLPTYRRLADVGLLEPISRELHHGAGDRLWQSLASLDTYRQQFASTPESLTNAILLGTLLVPLGLSPQPAGWRRRSPASLGQAPAGMPVAATGPRLGELPLARRDVERLRQILALQRRLRDLTATPRAQRALAHRHIFRDALTWFEIHGGTPDAAEHWKAVLAEAAGSHDPSLADGERQPATDLEAPPQRRRRRRRRRRPFKVANG